MKKYTFKNHLKGCHNLELVCKKLNLKNHEVLSNFHEWLDALDAEAWIEIGQDYADEVLKEDRRRAQETFEKVFLNKL